MSLVPYYNSSLARRSNSGPLSYMAADVKSVPPRSTPIIDLGVAGAKKLKEWFDKKNNAPKTTKPGGRALPAPSRGLLTYPQPVNYPTVVFPVRQQSRQVLRWSKPAGAARAWGPGLYADFAGSGFVDPFLL